LKEGISFDICYHIEENVWREQRSLQLNIKGIKINEYSIESVN